MKIDEIIKNGKFSDTKSFGVFEISLFVPLFNKETKVLACNISNIDPANNQLRYLEAKINELINFDLSNFTQLKEEIWNHYEFNMKNASYGEIDYEAYGMIDYSDTKNEEVNRTYFGVNNAEEAFNKLEINYINFDFQEDEEDEKSFFVIGLKCPWEDEHGIIIGIKDGQFNYIE